MSAAATMSVDSVRIAMHNVLEAELGQFHDLGPTRTDSPNISYSFEINLHGKPDAWDRPRVMRTQLFFDSAAYLQDFLSGLKNQIDQLRSKLYASMEKNNQPLDEPSVDTP